MDDRLALIGIIVQNEGSIPLLNEILHKYRDKIIGRMGLPSAREGISVISIVMSASGDEISALSGKLGQLGGVSAKAMFAKTEGGK